MTKEQNIEAVLDVLKNRDKYFAGTINEAVKNAIQILERRCKDCTYYRHGTLNFHSYCIWHNGFEPDEDWYCADFELKESDKI